MMPLNFFLTTNNNFSYYIDYQNIQFNMSKIYIEMMEQLHNPNLTQQEKMLVFVSKGSRYLQNKWPLVRFERAQYMSPEELDKYFADINSELNYLTNTSQENLLDNFENMFIFLRNAFKLDELNFFRVAIDLGVGVTKPYDPYYMDACAMLGIKPIYYVKPAVCKTTPLIMSIQHPMPAYEFFTEQLILPETKELNEKNNIAAVDLEPTEVEPTDLEPTEVEPTEVEPTEVEPAEVEPTEVEPTEVEPTEVEPTEVEPTEVEPTEVEPTEIEPTEVEPTEVEPTEVEPAEAEPTEVEPTEVEPTEVEPTEVEPTEVEPTEVEPTDVEPTEVEPTETTPKEVFLGCGSDLENTITKISNVIQKPSITQIVATLDVKKINVYMQENPADIKKVLNELQVKICNCNNFPKKLIMGLNCGIEFHMKLLSRIKNIAHKQVVISKICKFSDSDFYCYNVRKYINIKKLDLTPEVRKEYNSKLARSTNWFADQERKLLQLILELPKHADINNINFDLFALTKNSQQQSLLSLAIQKNLGIKTICALIKKSQAGTFEIDSLNLHPICYWHLYMPTNLNLLQEMWQQYIKFISLSELNKLLELPVDLDGNTLLHSMVLQKSPSLVNKLLNKILHLPKNAAIVRLLLVKNNYNQTPIDLVCKKSNCWENVIDCMLDMLTSINNNHPQTKLIIDKTLLVYYIKNNMLERLFKIVETFESSVDGRLPVNLNSHEKHTSNKIELRELFKDAKLRADLLDLIKRKNDVRVDRRFRGLIMPLFPDNLTINCSLAWLKLRAVCSGEKNYAMHTEDIKELRAYIESAHELEKKTKTVFDGRLYVLNSVLLCKEGIQLSITKFLVENCGLIMTDRMCAYVLIQNNSDVILEYVLQQRLHIINQTDDNIVRKREECAFVLRLYLTVTLLVPSKSKIRWLLDHKYDYRATLMDGNNILHHAVYIIRDGDPISKEMYDALEYLLQQDNVFDDLHHAKNKGEMNAMQTMALFRKENPMLAGPFEEFKRFMIDVAIDHYNPCFLPRPKWCRTNPRNMLLFSMAGIATTMLGLMLLQEQMEYLKLKL